ncbi:unnamed protein product [Angiostrongylus costaricensis]|uniref:Glycine-rich cell wall structural protein 1.8-like n=1 Tax=Angiostrongylus costaricensis TaxID=334426 RepID=A0A0R3PFH8_ANGCS|nr:unnamed protein product [Angiostrongylus costaricensis]
MTLLLLIIAAMAAITSSGYIPPYYGHYDYGGHYGDHDHKHGLYDLHYGSYEEKGGDDEHDYYGDKYGHHYGHDGHSVSGYGDRKHLAGRSYYDKNEASGSKGESYEMGGKTNSDSDGMRKFSYFAAGSGPYGEYKKGYYGSEGYEDSKLNSKYSAGSVGGGYKKGYYNEGSSHHKDHGSYSKDSVRGSKHGGHYEGSNYGHEHSGHDGGWRNSGYDSDLQRYEAHKPY